MLDSPLDTTGPREVDLHECTGARVGRASRHTRTLRKCREGAENENKKVECRCARGQMGDSGKTADRERRPISRGPSVVVISVTGGLRT